MIYDSFGDGICCGYGLGSYFLLLDGDTIRNGGEFSYQEQTIFNCPSGFYCIDPININEGIYTTDVGDTWYSFSPDSSGIFQISTCGMNMCDTKIWVYESCINNPDSTNAGTLFFLLCFFLPFLIN